MSAGYELLRCISTMYELGWYRAQLASRIQNIESNFAYVVAYLDRIAQLASDARKYCRIDRGLDEVERAARRANELLVNAVMAGNKSDLREAALEIYKVIEGLDELSYELEEKGFKHI